MRTVTIIAIVCAVSGQVRDANAYACNNRHYVYAEKVSHSAEPPRKFPSRLSAVIGIVIEAEIRVFQHRVIGGSSSTKADSIGGDLEEETCDGLFRWPRYLDGRDPCLRS